MENQNVGQKSHLVTLLLAFFLGGLGVHRFYTGYVGLGVLQLFTLGGCGIWSLIDFICICFNKFEDSTGCKLREYNQMVGLTFFFIWVAFTVMGVVIQVLSAMATASAMGEIMKAGLGG